MQTGHEKTLTALLPALAGANAIYGPGMLESGITLDFGQLVADNEFIAAIKQVLKGIPVDDETIASEVIQRVGAKGHFLGEDHTMQHMKSAHFLPEIIERTNYQDWRKNGSTDMKTRADTKAKNILENYKPDPLPEKVAKNLQSIFDEVKKELGKA